ncbi:MAG: Rrf2 family transcriptional regulator [Candidatus Latescibacterota bacterium]
MIISQACKYGLRAMVYLAQRGRAPVLSRDIAKELHIPEHFLAKILQDLSKNKLLHSFKGRGGGFRLARAPQAIRLLEVVEAIDGPDFGQGCLLGLPVCSEEAPCPLHHQWSDIKATMLHMLEQTSIQQVIEESCPLVANEPGQESGPRGDQPPVAPSA